MLEEYNTTDLVNLQRRIKKNLMQLHPDQIDSIFTLIFIATAISMQIIVVCSSLTQNGILHNDKLNPYPVSSMISSQEVWLSPHYLEVSYCGTTAEHVICTCAWWRHIESHRNLVLTIYTISIYIRTYVYKYASKKIDIQVTNKQYIHVAQIDLVQNHQQTYNILLSWRG